MAANLDLTETRVLIFIIVAQAGCAISWILDIVGLLPHLDQAARRIRRTESAATPTALQPAALMG